MTPLIFLLVFLLGFGLGLLIHHLKTTADNILPGHPDDWWL